MNYRIRVPERVRWIGEIGDAKRMATAPRNEKTIKRRIYQKMLYRPGHPHRHPRYRMLHSKVMVFNGVVMQTFLIQFFFFIVEHILAPSCVAGNQRFGNFRAGLESRWRVAHAIYPYMVCIALAYCVTLSLYPGIESEIVSCNLKSWMPVLLMFTFNTSDVMGKVMASIPYPWSRRQLILLSTMRIALVPLLLLCCAPRAQPIIAGETPPFIFSAALGITNGLAGSLPMMLAPAKVPATLKEVTGNMMTLSYNVGLTAGSLIGYVFDSMLGPQQLNPCPKYPYIPKYPYLFNTTTAATILPR